MNLQDYTEEDLLVAFITGEAKEYSLLNKIAVACVIRNRVNDSRWHRTWKEVILQPDQFSCFSPQYFQSEILLNPWEEIEWRECKYAIFGVYYNYVRDITNGANHYCDIADKPNWAKDLDPVLQIEQRLFYKL